jgi:hypothetical protein
MMVAFVETAEPARVSSQRGGLGHCSLGCTEPEIAEALR